MKLAILNDTHLGVRNSSELFLDNSAKFYDRIFFPYLKKHNIKNIVHLGDYYDNRMNINIRALAHNRAHFLNVLRDEKIHMDILPGNHDTYYKSTNDLNSLKELLGHFMKEVNIIHEPEILKYESLEIGMVPWINPENYAANMNWIRKCKADFLFGHFEFAGFNVSKSVVSESGMDHEEFSNFEQILSGHFHTSSSHGNVWYLGSQMEFTWSDAHDPKFFHVIDTETREITKISNPHTIFHNIVYNDSEIDYNDYDFSVLDGKFIKISVVNKKDIYEFDKFINRVENRKILSLKIDENFEEYLGENVEAGKINIEDTATLLNTYVDNVDTGLNKTKIKEQMAALHGEAQLEEFT